MRENTKDALLILVGFPAGISTVIALVIFVVGLSMPTSSGTLANRAKKVPAEKWRTWASQMLNQASVDSNSLPNSSWPDFVQEFMQGRGGWTVNRVPDGPDTNGPMVVELVSLGGFDSVGINIGPPSYVENPPPGYCVILVHPGIYIRQTP